MVVRFEGFVNSGDALSAALLDYIGFSSIVRS